MERRMEATKGGRERGARKEFERLYSGYVDLNVGPSDKNKKYVCEGSLDFWALAQPIATRLNCCTTHVLARKWGHMYNIQQSYHNEHTHFCREMCNIVNTRFLRPFGVITEITTQSPQKL